MPEPSIHVAPPKARGGLSVFRLVGAYSTLEVASQGAQVIDWTIPATPPVLFVSPKSSFLPKRAIRGGVPLVFPWFGPRLGNPAAAQHGFARIRDWTVQSAEVETDGTCVVAMTLADDEHTRVVWPHAFGARCVVRAGQQLRVALEIRNTGRSAFTFEAALHTYLSVSDVRHIRVRGLENAEYLDKVGGNVRKREAPAPITFTGETDRVYLDTTSACTVEDPDWKRRIVVAKSGSCSTVIWNPWIDKARALGDLGDAAWTGMVCVETANAGDDARTLAPFASHVLEATIAVDGIETALASCIHRGPQ